MTTVPLAMADLEPYAVAASLLAGAMSLERLDPGEVGPLVLLVWLLFLIDRPRPQLRLVGRPSVHQGPASVLGRRARAKDGARWTASVAFAASGILLAWGAAAMNWPAGGGGLFLSLLAAAAPYGILPNPREKGDSWGRRPGGSIG